MNSAYASNSQPRVPTRVSQGHVVTTDLLTLWTNPNSKQHGSATQEAKDLGTLWSSKLTVRDGLVDSPWGASRRSVRSRWIVRNSNPNLQYAPSEIWMVCELTADSSLLADSPASPSGWSGQQDPTKTYWPNRAKRSDSRTHEEHDEHQAEELLADGPPGSGAAAQAWNRKHQSTSPSMDVPTGLSYWGKIWGRCEASPGDAILWCPRFLVNLNCMSTQLTVVKPWSTWAITLKTSLTHTLELLRQANTRHICQNPS
jgi:hypothetical protein